MGDKSNFRGVSLGDFLGVSLAVLLGVSLGVLDGVRLFSVGLLTPSILKEWE